MQLNMGDYSQYELMDMKTLDEGLGPHLKIDYECDPNRKSMLKVVPEARNFPFKHSIFDEANLSHILGHAIETEVGEC